MNPKQFSQSLVRGSCLLLALLFMGEGNGASGQSVDELQVGHWIVVRGTLMESGRFEASQVNLCDPESIETLVGVVEQVGPNAAWIEVLQQRVSLSDRTRYRKIDPAKLLGARVKLEGHYRNSAKFSARKISARGAGRQRITGRIDNLQRSPSGLTLGLMGYHIEISASSKYVRDGSLSDYAISAPRSPQHKPDPTSTSGLLVRVDDDYLPGSYQLSESLRIGLRTEISRTTERDLDLDGAQADDRIDDDFSLRAVAIWSPSERFFMRFAGRFSQKWRQDEVDGRLNDSSFNLSEAYAYWSQLFGQPIDLQVGRQDYYDEREWLWDENLDALRLLYHPKHWIIELAAATTLSNASPREEDTDRFILNATRHWPNRMIGAYLIDQRGQLNGRDYPLFAGVRAYGEWLEDHKTWAELSLVRGYEGSTDIRGLGWDLGSTWSPTNHKPWYFSAGYAFGSGDGDSTDGKDGAFRQTGIQDNNDKFGGVTSFKYYGELLEPELSNIHILTAGIGRRFGRRLSLDLVYHHYTQDEAFDRLRDSNLNLRPNGIRTGIGQELDLIFGHRASNGLDTEIVLSAFDPGDAFDDGRRSYLVKFQLRYRLR